MPFNLPSSKGELVVHVPMEEELWTVCDGRVRHVQCRRRGGGERREILHSSPTVSVLTTVCATLLCAVYWWKLESDYLFVDRKACICSVSRKRFSPRRAFIALCLEEGASFSMVLWYEVEFKVDKVFFLSDLINAANVDYVTDVAGDDYGNLRREID